MYTRQPAMTLVMADYVLNLGTRRERSLLRGVDLRDPCQLPVGKRLVRCCDEAAESGWVQQPANEKTCRQNWQGWKNTEGAAH